MSEANDDWQQGCESPSTSFMSTPLANPSSDLPHAMKLEQLESKNIPSHLWKGQGPPPTFPLNRGDSLPGRKKYEFWFSIKNMPAGTKLDKDDFWCGFIDQNGAEYNDPKLSVLETKIETEEKGKILGVIYKGGMSFAPAKGKYYCVKYRHRVVFKADKPLPKMDFNTQNWSGRQKRMRVPDSQSSSSAQLDNEGIQQNREDIKNLAKQIVDISAKTDQNTKGINANEQSHLKLVRELEKKKFISQEESTSILPTLANRTRGGENPKGNTFDPVAWDQSDMTLEAKLGSKYHQPNQTSLSPKTVCRGRIQNNVCQPTLQTTLPPFYCTVCETKCTSSIDLKIHKEGKAHNRKINLLTESNVRPLPSSPRLTPLLRTPTRQHRRPAPLPSSPNPPSSYPAAMSRCTDCDFFEGAGLGECESCGTSLGGCPPNDDPSASDDSFNEDPSAGNFSRGVDPRPFSNSLMGSPVDRLISLAGQEYTKTPSKRVAERKGVPRSVSPSSTWTQFVQEVDNAKMRGILDNYGSNGNTVLAAAVNANQFDDHVLELNRVPFVVKYLLDAGASIDRRTKKGTHVLQIAIKTKKGEQDGTDMFRYLLSRMPPGTDLGFAKKFIQEHAEGKRQKRNVMKYWASRAEAIKPPNEEEMQIWKIRGIERLLELQMLMIGNDEAVREITNAIKVFRMTWETRKGKPLVIALPGSSGVGKTMSAKKVAELLGDDDAYLQIPCGSHDIHKILGHSNMYKGDGFGMVPRFLHTRQNKWTVIVFDELEKIQGWDTKGFLHALYQLIDEGTIHDQSNTLKEEISARQCIFIFTTNVGEKEVLAELKKQDRKTLKERRKNINKAASKAFKKWLHNVTGSHAFWGRVAKCVSFAPYTRNELELLIDDRVRRYLVYYSMGPEAKQEKLIGGLDITVHPSITKHMMTEADLSLGYRSVEEMVLKYVETPVLESFSDIKDANTDEKKNATAWLGLEDSSPQIFLSEEDLNGAMKKQGAEEESVEKNRKEEEEWRSDSKVSTSIPSTHPVSLGEAL